MLLTPSFFFFFFFNDTATTEIYTLSLHDALPIYGITELVRPALGNARLVANPGCYPTVAQLPLVPLVRAGLIDADDIIVDAKSGVTGAGRELKQTSLFAEVAEGIAAYGVANHRHAPEIDQGLSAA